MEIKVGTMTAKVPFEGAEHVIIKKCPNCGEHDAPMFGVDPVRGFASMSSRDTLAKCCNTLLGLRMTVRFNTIFGLEEDERVLHGRCRVY